jgi:DNA polymerase
MAGVICGIDVETYSSVDLLKAGVYAYVESPDFEILLLGYVFSDEDAVTVVDIGQAESLDDHPRLKAALLEDNPENVTFTAFNVNFERTCLAKWTGVAMPPEEWRCTMIKALTMGLPGSLAGAGAALGLPEDKLKDPQGKALIQFFSKPCKPTRTNGQRTRNLPAHDPEKWKLFIAYNRQDVITEQEILKRLAIYKIPDAEQAL